jgi:hypothetical protein
MTDLIYKILLRHIVDNSPNNEKMVEHLFDLKNAKKFKSKIGESSSGDRILGIEYYTKDNLRVEYSIIIPRK